MKLFNIGKETTHTVRLKRKSIVFLFKSKQLNFVHFVSLMNAFLLVIKIAWPMSIKPNKQTRTWHHDKIYYTASLLLLLLSPFSFALLRCCRRCVFVRNVVVTALLWSFLMYHYCCLCIDNVYMDRCFFIFLFRPFYFKRVACLVDALLSQCTMWLKSHFSSLKI